MQLAILSSDIQDFINQHLYEAPSALVLKGIPFDKSLHQVILDQVASRLKAKKKLPEWFRTKGIYYPATLNLEQTSSEITAKYKASLVNGESLIDLTGGFGVDSHYFSKNMASVIHCELNTELQAIAKHNSEVFGTTIEFISGDGITILKDLDREFDWVYLDPSRRTDSKEKVFLLSDCTPNAKTFKGLFLKYAKQVMIKTSPLLDIKKTLGDLEFVKTVHIVAVNNEVKELLWILERNFSGQAQVQTINFDKKEIQELAYDYEESLTVNAKLSLPRNYLYEPNAAILKSGAFQFIGETLKTFKLAQHSHLYTSETLIAFPGRRFKILKTLPFHKKQFAKEGIKKANITTRNFPMSVHDIRKKLNIKDGGEYYLFFTTLMDGKKAIIICAKI